MTMLNTVNGIDSNAYAVMGAVRAMPQTPVSHRDVAAISALAISPVLSITARRVRGDYTPLGGGGHFPLPPLAGYWRGRPQKQADVATGPGGLDACQSVAPAQHIGRP